MKNRQCDRLLEYMRKRKEMGITQKEAMDMLGIYRLGARIWDLKHMGYKIQTVMVKVDTREPGVSTKVAKYILLED